MTHKALFLVTWLGIGWAGSLLAQEPFEEFSCASFPADLSETELAKRYGNANVKRAQVTGSDDGPQDGTVVFGDTARRLEVVWWDPQTRSKLAWVRSRELSSPWQTPNGISIGMDLLDIERRNGHPFRSSGHPAMQAINPRVASLWVFHDPRP
jgi:hypothetical protein